MADQSQILSDYNLGAIPGYDIDPRELERMKMLGLIRMGLGMAGREPIGSALTAGINTTMEGQVNARREMLARLQAYAERQKIDAIAAQQAKEKTWLASMSPEQRAKYGITPEVWAAYQGVKDPAEKFIASDLVKPYTLQPGQPRVIPGIGVTGVIADPQGRMPIFAPGGTVQLGTYNVPGAVQAAEETAQAQARGTGLGKAATEFENVPLPITDPRYKPGLTEPVLRSRMIAEQTANATQAAAQRTLQTYDAHIADEQGLLTKAIADNDPVRQRKHEENIKNLQAGKEKENAKWQQYAPATAPVVGPRISDPVAVKEAEAAIPKWDAASGQFVSAPMPNAPTGRAFSPEGFQKPDKELTESQSKATAFANQMSAATKVHSELAAKGFKGEGVWQQADLAASQAEGIPYVPGTAAIPRWLSSDAAQKWTQAELVWTEAALRFMTGANAPKEEVIRNTDTYFPRTGDSAARIAQKAEMRRNLETSIRMAAGPGLKKLPPLPQGAQGGADVRSQADRILAGEKP